METVRKSTAEYELDNYKKFSIKAAEELGYQMENLKEKIMAAESIFEVSRLMAKAREEYWHDKN